MQLLPLLNCTFRRLLLLRQASEGVHLGPGKVVRQLPECDDAEAFSVFDEAFTFCRMMMLLISLPQILFVTRVLSFVGCLTTSTPNASSFGPLGST
jgi:hypothetical protein